MEIFEHGNTLPASLYVKIWDESRILRKRGRVVLGSFKPTPMSMCIRRSTERQNELDMNFGAF